MLRAMSSMVLGLVAAAALTGCATYGDIRAKAPVKEVAVGGAPTAVAECAFEKLQLKYATGSPGGVTFQKMDTGDTIHISSQVNGWSGPTSYLSDITFAPGEAGKTNIELRATSDVWGRPQIVSDLWDIIGTCSKSA